MDDNLHTRKRNESLLSFIGNNPEDIKIGFLDRIVSKVDAKTMEEDNYFEFEVLIGKKRLHKIEKRYKDFKAFEQVLSYGLRDSGIDPPKLEEDVFGKLMG